MYVIDHINRLKEISYVIITIGKRAKALDSIHPTHDVKKKIQTSQQNSARKKILLSKKDIYQKLRVNIILTSGNSEAFPLKLNITQYFYHWFYSAMSWKS